MWHALQVPQEVFVPEPVVQVAAGHHHTLFLTQSGDVWACGRNSRGQLGLGSKAGSQLCTPQPLSALAGFDHIGQLCVTLPACLQRCQCFGACSVTQSVSCQEVSGSAVNKAQ